MTKRRLLVVAFIAIFVSLHAMERYTPHIELKRHEGIFNYVTIQSIKIVVYCPINDSTTIKDIKNLIFKEERIPLEQQKLFTFDSCGFTTWVTDKDGNTVQNSHKVEELVERYKTNNFYIYTDPKIND